ncbi:MAG TPA: c-type cytochrome [Longimicrobiales bacterium]
MTAGLLGLVLLAAACGDNDTTDHRGYTKAPLERPTVLVQAEDPSPMDALGTPAGPDAPIIEAPDTTKAAQPAAGAAPAATAGPGQAPAGATAADVQEGQKIFTSTGNCFTCHGQGGTGTAMAPALNDQTWIHIDGSWDAIQKLVKAGVPQPKEHPAPMPAMGGAALSDAQIKQVAAYVYSLSHK